jgi:hypothetical protein
LLLDDIETYLNTFGAYTQDTTTYTLRKHFSPETPDAVIVLLEVPIGAPMRAMGASVSAPVRERSGLCVRVRGPQQDYSNARSMAETVYQRLDFLNTTLSGRQYSLSALHAPVLYQEDRNNRWWIDTTFLVLKERG